MSVKLERTGKRIPFLKVSIGSVFHAHGCYWTRTSYDAGTVLSGSNDRMGSCCNFLIDGTDWIVEGQGQHKCEGVEEVKVTQR